MNRRQILKLGSMAGVAVMLPTLANAADDSQPKKEEAVVQIEIGANHGHELTLTVAQTIQLLRKTKNAPPAVLDIQGESGHPHSLELTHENLLTLFVDGELNKSSTLVARHSHEILLKLIVEEENAT